MKFIIEPLDKAASARGCTIKGTCPFKTYYIIPPW